MSKIEDIEYDGTKIYVDPQVLKEHDERIIKKNHKKYWISKVIFDKIVSFFVLLLLSPLFVLVSTAIVLDDPHGGPFYKQTRIGRHGKPFKMYKFRSMVVGADKMVDQLADKNEADGPAFKIKDDPRITRIGHFIRKTSIDELPQFLNVLKGDMTIVGPRPALPREVEQYDEKQKARLLVTPGLTCFWQVMPNRNEIGFDEWVDLDLQYISERTLKQDIKLIIQTIKVMISGEGR